MLKYPSLCSTLMLSAFLASMLSMPRHASGYSLTACKDVISVCHDELNNNFPNGTCPYFAISDNEILRNEVCSTFGRSEDGAPGVTVCQSYFHKITIKAPNGRSTRQSWCPTISDYSTICQDSYNKLVAEKREGIDCTK